MTLRTSLAVFLLVVILAACSSGGTPTATRLPDPSAQPSSAPLSTDTPLPAPSPTSPPARVLLVASADSDATLLDSVKSALADLAAGSQLELETRDSLAVSDLQPQDQVLVFLQPPADLSDLQAAAPQAQFLVISGQDLPAADRLSVIREPEENRAFMAGYIATIVAPDWRSAGLLPDDPAQLQDAFINGGRYWCGRCIPIYAPVVLFPVAATRPAGTDAAGWEGAVSELQQNILDVVYLSPQAYSPDLVKALVDQQLLLVGTQFPGADQKDSWIATLNFDPVPALKQLWPDLVAGKGGQIAAAGLSWTDVNEDLFTPGKQRLAQQALDGLLDGSVSPLSVP